MILLLFIRIFDRHLFSLPLFLFSFRFFFAQPASHTSIFHSFFVIFISYFFLICNANFPPS